MATFKSRMKTLGGGVVEEPDVPGVLDPCPHPHQPLSHGECLHAATQTAGRPVDQRRRDCGCCSQVQADGGKVSKHGLF